MTFYAWGFCVSTPVLSIIRALWHLPSIDGKWSKRLWALAQQPGSLGSFPCERHGLSALCYCCPVQTHWSRGASPLMIWAQCWWVWLYSCSQLILGSDRIGNMRIWASRTLSLYSGVQAIVTVEVIFEALLCTKGYLSIFSMVVSGKGIHSMRVKEQVLNTELPASL